MNKKTLLDTSLESNISANQMDQNGLDDALLNPTQSFEQATTNAFDAGSDSFGQDLFNTGWFSPEGESNSATTSRLMEEKKKFMEDNKGYAAIGFHSLRADWMTGGEMLLFTLISDGTAYVHPCFYGTGAGVSREVPGTSGATVFVSESNVMKTMLDKENIFKTAVADLLLRAGAINSKVHESIRVTLCGSSILDNSNSVDITFKKLIGVATIEMFNTYEFATGRTAPGSISIEELKNCSINVNIGARPDAYNVYGQPIFAPVEIELLAKKKNGFENNLGGTGGFVLARIWGYMDVARTNPLEYNPQNFENGRIPGLQATFVARGISLGDNSKRPSPVSLLAVLSTLTTIKNSTLLMDKVIQAQQADKGNATYKYSAIGFLALENPKPFTAINNPEYLDIEKRANHNRNAFVPNVRVALDVFDSGPYASAARILATAKGMTQAVQMLTGIVRPEFNPGYISSPIPYQTFKRGDGKQRDAAELTNMFSLLTLLNGSVSNVQREVSSVLGMTQTASVADNLRAYSTAKNYVEDKLAANSSTQLLGEYQRLVISPKILITIANALTNNGVSLNYKDTSSDTLNALYAVPMGGNVGNMSYTLNI